MNKILKWFLLRLPISRKRYYEELQNIKIIIDGIIQADKQHSQIEMNLVKNVDLLVIDAQKKKEKNGQKKNNDVAFT